MIVQAGDGEKFAAGHAGSGVTHAAPRSTIVGCCWLACVYAPIGLGSGGFPHAAHALSAILTAPIGWKRANGAVRAVFIGVVSVWGPAAPLPPRAA